jgi:hypothetical protein
MGPPSETVELFRCRLLSVELVGQGIERDKELGGDLIAPAFGSFCRLLREVRIGESGLPKPEMSELVRNREDLRCFRVCAVDEDEGRQGVNKRESPELSRIQLPVRVAPDEAVHHDEDSMVLRFFCQLAERVRERGPPLLDLESEAALALLPLHP